MFKKLITIYKKINYKLTRLYHEKIVFRVKNKENIFSSIWEHNYWGSSESLSGPGSTMDQTENIRINLPILIKELEIKKIFDAPCGDMHWMQHILRSIDIDYCGADIVSDIVLSNQNKYSNKRIKICKLDITSDKFPPADVWLCRATFYHLSFSDIYLALQNFLESDIDYILTTNCETPSGHVNIDIPTGDWRSLNLKLPPFNFPNETLWEIDDSKLPHPPMKLSLWSKQQIKSALDR